ncbi:MAG: two-component system, sensor histidine kinase and response regulator [Bacteroidales bacterium]|jgi:signal transduction histidine kinase|nr:two-component system, sensor histidine kinase and response regulator [Bacteroidales bacterium]
MARLKILVVDDEPFIRSGIQRILQNFRVDYPFMEEPFEFDILEAATGEEGIEIINNQKPDIVLLDNKLPGIQGVEVLSFIKSQKLDMVVVMITSYASLDLAVRATSDGAHDFIPKPFTPQELKSAIESITKQVFLRRMTREMQVTGKQIRFQFLSVLSHELKAPLNAIEGYLRMMQEKQLGDKIDDYQQVIDRSLQRIKGMRSLILDLLDMTRIESGQKEKKIEHLNLREIVQTALDTAKPMAIQRDISLKLISPDQVWLDADVTEMEIIFNNLISNAVKYNKTGGSVECILSQTENEVVLEVKDTGIGMTQEEAARLFQEFVRIKNEKTKEITGTGLGLSIVKKIVTTYAGTITVESTPDIGSRFIVKIPYKSEKLN